jgi:hypothetical protein
MERNDPDKLARERKRQDPDIPGAPPPEDEQG